MDKMLLNYLLLPPPPPPTNILSPQEVDFVIEHDSLQGNLTKLYYRHLSVFFKHLQ
jgi:hypothetical protein